MYFNYYYYYQYLGDDSIWTLLNYDFCIFFLQFLKFFTIYNFTVLDICNHKPSIVKTVIEEYRQPDNDLQYISIMPNDSEDEEDDDDEIREVKVNQNDKKNAEESKNNANIQSSNSSKNKKRQQHKYEVKRGFLGRLFKKGKDVGDFDNDENTLLINKDEESEIEEEEEDGIIIEEENNSKNSLKSNSRRNSIDNLLSEIDEAILSAESPTSPTTKHTPLYSSTLPPLIPSENPIEPSTTTSSLPPPDSLINLTSHPIINTEEEKEEKVKNEEQTSSSKEKGKLPAPSNTVTPSTPSNGNNNKKDKKKKGKEAAVDGEEEGGEDEFYDAHGVQDFISSSTTAPQDEFPTNTNAIPLRHVNSTSSTSAPRLSSFYSQLHSNHYTSATAGQDDYYYSSTNGAAGTSSVGVDAAGDSNSLPVYAIDERERITEGNENALLYLESYYEFVPVINIRVQEAIDTILAIRSSNRRNNTPEKREERRQILEVYEQTQKAEKLLKQLESMRRHRQGPFSSSTSSVNLPGEANALYQEPESDPTDGATGSSRMATSSSSTPQSPSPSRTRTRTQRRSGSTTTAPGPNDTNPANGTNNSTTATVSNQLRSYINGLHNSFRRSLTGISPL